MRFLPELPEKTQTVLRYQRLAGPLARPLPHVVELPQELATANDPVIGLKSIKRAIRQWLRENVDHRDYFIGDAGDRSVTFLFASQEKAALFKLFWR